MNTGVAEEKFLFINSFFFCNIKEVKIVKEEGLNCVVVPPIMPTLAYIHFKRVRTVMITHEKGNVLKLFFKS